MCVFVRKMKAQSNIKNATSSYQIQFSIPVMLERYVASPNNVHHPAVDSVIHVCIQYLLAGLTRCEWILTNNASYTQVNTKDIAVMNFLNWSFWILLQRNDLNSHRGGAKSVSFMLHAFLMLFPGCCVAFVVGTVSLRFVGLPSHD